MSRGAPDAPGPAGAAPGGARHGRIVFDTIHAGGGHVATARAMAQAVGRAAGDRYRTETRDTMLHLGLEHQDAGHKDAWARLLRVPVAVRIGQRILDALPAAVVAVQRRTLDELARRVAADYEREPADLIVVNHGFLVTAHARAQRRYGLSVPVLVFATEPFDANALWADPAAERVVAPSAAARRALVRLGVPEERIDQLGYPVGEAFLTAPSLSEARASLGAPAGPRALLSLGGEGVAPSATAGVDALLARGLGVDVVAGRNAGLASELRGRYAGETRVRVHGFTDRMPELIAAADVVVGKAGPASVMEALAVGRPFLVTAYAGLNELAVTRFLEARGLGGRVPGPAALADAALAAAAGEGAFEGVAGRLAALPFRAMADDLGRHVLAVAERRAPPPPLVRTRPGWDGPAPS